MNQRGIAAIGFLLILFSLTSLAQATRLVAVSMSRAVSEEMIPEGITDSFAPDAAAIHAVAVFADVGAGTKVRGTWVAVDAVETPNYEIDSTVMELEAGEARAHFQITRPNNGWPPGNYKLQLHIDGVFVTSASFRVGQAAGASPFAPAASPQPQTGSVPSLGGVAAPTTSSSVAGVWQCRMSMNGMPLGGGPISFGADGQARIGGQSFRYETLPGNILRLQDPSGQSDYNYEVAGDNLSMRFTDGSAFACVRSGAGGATSPGMPPTGGTGQPPQGYGQQDGTGQQPGTGQVPGGYGARGGGMGASGDEWQLQGTFCNWSGSSNYYSSSDYSSYGSTRRINFDGRGRWTYGAEASFTSDAGNAYSGGGAGESGMYRVAGNQIQYQTANGQQGAAQVKMRQNDGRITEILVDGNLYAPALCE